jgi:hypothetical protein
MLPVHAAAASPSMPTNRVIERFMATRCLSKRSASHKSRHSAHLRVGLGAECQGG